MMFYDFTRNNRLYDIYNSILWQRDIYEALVLSLSECICDFVQTNN